MTEDPQRPESIQIDKLIAVPASVEISDEFGLRDHDRPRVVVRMKAQGVLLPQIPVEKQVHVIFRVVDQSERRYGTRTESQIPFHPLFGSERELSLSQPAFEIADRQISVAVENDEVMPVAFMIAEKKIFAVFRAVVAPIQPGQFDRRGRRMLVIVVPQGIPAQIIKKRFAYDPSFGNFDTKL